MIEHTYRVLGYYRLLDVLSGFSACPLGQSDCLSLKPSNDPKQIDDELRLVSEMRLLLKAEGPLPLSDVSDVVPILRKSGVQGSCLEPEGLLRILRLAEASRKSKKFIRLRKALFSKLYDLVRDTPEFEDLIKTLEGTISPEGSIKDSASPALRNIRDKKIQLRRDLEKRLESIRRSEGLSGETQDNLVTVRDGRYVIALRTDQRGRIDGIIHDYSRTKATCFLEPVEVIQDNNRAAELAQEEREEEFNILENLTGMVRSHSADLEYAQTLIGRLDGLFARARFSEAQSCVAPEIGNEYGIELKGAKNPILMALRLEEIPQICGNDFPVPIDIMLESNHNVLVISGPNRGGKTVALKTLGLMSLMAQAGIPIPAEEGSCLPVFDKVIAEIGDDQDIQAGLSTFSAHAAHLTYILEHAGKKSLIIIDEPGMGTDPDEGVALSMSVLDFLSRQGAFVAVSTHSNRLKAYSISNKRAVNASVEFDNEKDRPTFKLSYGVPGISHAFEIARDMGLPTQILDRAKGYLDRDEVRLNRLIDKMNSLIMDMDKEKTEAKALKEKYFLAAEKMKERLLSFEFEKKALMEEKRLEAEAVIGEAREELKQVINLLKKKKESVQSRVAETHADVSRKLMRYFDQEVGENNGKSYAQPEKFKKGLLVYHKGLKQKGVVQSIDSLSGRVLVMLGKMKVSAAIEDIEPIEETQDSSIKKSVPSVSWDINKAPLRELNVIGYRVEDAIPLIDKTLDRALVNGDLTLRIIHGFGTGRLREAIRSHLRTVPFVKSVCSGDVKYGGDAITVVEL